MVRIFEQQVEHNHVDTWSQKSKGAFHIVCAEIAKGQRHRPVATGLTWGPDPCIDHVFGVKTKLDSLMLSCVNISGLSACSDLEVSL